jgi:hypothetical protein
MKIQANDVTAADNIGIPPDRTSSATGSYAVEAS